MEMPITKPSLALYADELDFQNLLDDLNREKKNGFIRVTSGSEEGYILFKEGKRVAASYEEYAKLDAVDEIFSAMDNSNTLIEVFDVGLSQIDFLLDLNKPYKFDEVANVYDTIDELKRTTEEEAESESAPEPVLEPVLEADIELESESAPEPVLEAEPQVQKVSEPVVVAKEKPSVSEVPSKELESLKASTVTEEPVVGEKTIEPPKPSELEESPESFESSATEEPEEELPADRSELLKKYGIKDVEEEQVTNLLQTYKGGIIDDEDVEKVELVLMNTIKKSVLGIPKIKGTEVMVFLDNFNELTGTINIIAEYESRGFLNKLMGQSKTSNNLIRQIINIAEIEIRKCFREYPEVVEKFDINVEFN